MKLIPRKKSKLLFFSLFFNLIVNVQTGYSHGVTQNIINPEASSSFTNKSYFPDEKKFRDMITFYKIDTFEGVGQNILGNNTAQNLTVQYTISKLNSRSPVYFNFSSFAYSNSNYNNSFPLVGEVFFQITDSQGHLIPYIDNQSGEEVTLGLKKFQLYVVETQKSFEERRIRANWAGISPLPEFPFIAVVGWDFTRNEIHFYERFKSNPKVLIYNGIFNGFKR